MRAAVKRYREGKAAEKDEKGTLLQNLLIALLPCFNFDLSSGDGLRAYNDHLTGKLGGFLTWVPFIIILTVAHTNVTIAIWAAFGVQSFEIIIFFLRGTYDEKYPSIMILESGMWLAYLGLGIAYAIKPFVYTLISPITTSSLFATAFFSLMICHPFTAQIARAKVSAEIAGSEGFKKMMYIVTIFWTTIFSLMTILTWLAYGLYPVVVGEKKELGAVLMGTIVPVALPLLGKISQPYLIEHLKASAGMNTQASPAKADLEEADVIRK
eukprot:gb/GEZN01009287.1/.p1 GENE.gb/GEZN01009287.1/~~gb/GEZN01009287.1/.p1  ORF type:complete len:268 (-),score=26.22 gb/GEZN01009287.1/:499-1302(-)